MQSQLQPHQLHAEAVLAWRSSVDPSAPMLHDDLLMLASVDDSALADMMGSVSSLSLLHNSSNSAAGSSASNSNSNSSMPSSTRSMSLLHANSANKHLHHPRRHLLHDSVLLDSPPSAAEQQAAGTAVVRRLSNSIGRRTAIDPQTMTALAANATTTTTTDLDLPLAAASSSTAVSPWTPAQPAHDTVSLSLFSSTIGSFSGSALSSPESASASQQQQQQPRLHPIRARDLDNPSQIGLCSLHLVRLEPAFATVLKPTATVLQLCCNHLSYLPPHIGHLSNLTVLVLSRNKLTQLPVTLGHLQNLVELDVSHNALMDLPDSLFSLSKLLALNLENNKLTDIPPSIGNLSNLTSLDLSRNQVRVLPAELMRLKFLRNIGLEGCPLYTTFTNPTPAADSAAQQQQQQSSPPQPRRRLSISFAIQAAAAQAVASAAQSTDQPTTPTTLDAVHSPPCNVPSLLELAARKLYYMALHVSSTPDIASPPSKLANSQRRASAATPSPPSPSPVTETDGPSGSLAARLERRLRSLSLSGPSGADAELAAAASAAEQQQQQPSKKLKRLQKKRSDAQLASEESLQSRRPSLMARLLSSSPSSPDVTARRPSLVSLSNTFTRKASVTSTFSFAPAASPVVPRDPATGYTVVTVQFLRALIAYSTTLASYANYPTPGQQATATPPPPPPQLARLPPYLLALLTRPRQCSFCSGPCFTHFHRRYAMIQRGESIFPTCWTLCSNHWDYQQQQQQPKTPVYNHQRHRTARPAPLVPVDRQQRRNGWYGGDAPATIAATATATPPPPAAAPAMTTRGLERQRILALFSGNCGKRLFVPTATPPDTSKKSTATTSMPRRASSLPTNAAAAAAAATASPQDIKGKTPRRGSILSTLPRWFSSSPSASPQLPTPPVPPPKRQQRRQRLFANTPPDVYARPPNPSVVKHRSYKDTMRKVADTVALARNLLAPTPPLPPLASPSVPSTLYKLQAQVHMQQIQYIQYQQHQQAQLVQQQQQQQQQQRARPRLASASPRFTAPAIAEVPDAALPLSPPMSPRSTKHKKRPSVTSLFPAALPADHVPPPAPFAHHDSVYESQPDLAAAAQEMPSPCATPTRVRRQRTDGSAASTAESRRSRSLSRSRTQPPQSYPAPSPSQKVLGTSESSSSCAPTAPSPTAPLRRAQTFVQQHQQASAARIRSRSLSDPQSSAAAHDFKFLAELPPIPTLPPLEWSTAQADR
ncbi:hypothetical protein RI367_005844 [Sorochytrium milnesiophthora]